MKTQHLFLQMFLSNSEKGIILFWAATAFRVNFHSLKMHCSLKTQSKQRTEEEDLKNEGQQQTDKALNLH